MINRAAATANDIKPVPKPVPPVTTTVSTPASTRSYITQPTPPPAPSIPVAVVPPPPSLGAYFYHFLCDKLQSVKLFFLLAVHDMDSKTKIVPNLDKVKTEG